MECQQEDAKPTDNWDILIQEIADQAATEINKPIDYKPIYHANIKQFRQMNNSTRWRRKIWKVGNRWYRRKLKNELVQCNVSVLEEKNIAGSQN